MLVVGLGNPGEGYKNNRHNIGFMAVQTLLHRHFSTLTLTEKFKGQYGAGLYQGQKVHFLLPQTYMNNSGEAVRAALDFFKLTAEEVIVVHDELDLPLGEVRLKKGGGHAGHNGLRSILQHLGTPDFLRIRCGIGHPGQKELVTGHVLGNFTSAEQEAVHTMCALAAERVLEVLNT